MRKKPDPWESRSGINIPDPQHCFVPKDRNLAYWKIHQIFFSLYQYFGNKLLQFYPIQDNWYNIASPVGSLSNQIDPINFWKREDRGSRLLAFQRQNFEKSLKFSWETTKHAQKKRIGEFVQFETEKVYMSVGTGSCKITCRSSVIPGTWNGARSIFLVYVLFNTVSASQIVFRRAPSYEIQIIK